LNAVDNIKQKTILTVVFGLSEDRLVVQRRGISLGQFLAEITGLGLAVYYIFSVFICEWFSNLAVKVHVIVNGFKFSNRTYDYYTGQLIPNRINLDDHKELTVSWCNILCCCRGGVRSRIDGAYDRYSKLMDVPEFIRQMKYLKVAMKGLLSVEQHNFCNRYATNAMVDDAEDSEDQGDGNGPKLLRKKKEKKDVTMAPFIESE